MSWPPKVGEPLPRAAEATGLRRKLMTYSLDVTHQDGGPKARGFERILGITTADIDYLEGAILTGILLVALVAVRETSWGAQCLVMTPLRGRRDKQDRIVNLRTVWEIADRAAPPRLVNAYLKP